MCGKTWNQMLNTQRQAGNRAKGELQSPKWKQQNLQKQAVCTKTTTNQKLWEHKEQHIDDDKTDLQRERERIKYTGGSSGTGETNQDIHKRKTGRHTTWHMRMNLKKKETITKPKTQIMTTLSLLVFQGSRINSKTQLLSQKDERSLKCP